MAKPKNSPKKEVVDYPSLINTEFDKITGNLETAKNTFEKFESGTKSAATKSRNALQEIKKSCQSIRENIQKMKEDKESKE